MQINALVASRVITMEPVDVARVFNTTNVPSTSLLRELQSALRVFSIAQGYDKTNKNDIKSESNANDQVEEVNQSNTEESSSNNVLEPKNAMLARYKSIIEKWSATLVALLTASIPVEDNLSSTKNNHENDEQDRDEEVIGSREKKRNVRTGGGLSAQSNNNNMESNPTHRPSVRFAINASAIGANNGNNNLNEANELNLDNNNNNIINSFDNQEESIAHAVVCPAPKSLYFGYYDLSTSEMEYMKSLSPETWYVLTNVTVAREDCPVDERLLQYNATRSSNNNKLNQSNAQKGKTSQIRESEEQNELQEQQEREINDANNYNNTSSTTATKNKSASEAINYQENMSNNVTPISPTREWLTSANTVSTTSNNTNTNMVNTMTGSIPDNAILFEVCAPLECLELADLSLYPYSRE